MRRQVKIDRSSYLATFGPDYRTDIIVRLHNFQLQT